MRCLVTHHLAVRYDRSHQASHREAELLDVKLYALDPDILAVARQCFRESGIRNAFPKPPEDPFAVEARWIVDPSGRTYQEYVADET